MTRLVVFTGIPASGKSSLGAQLAAALNLELLDKDALIERLFVVEGTGSSAHRRALSRQADEELKAAARKSPGAVVVSWWRHPESQAESGTEPWWLRESGLAVCEVHCQCSPEVALARFLARRRHPGHLDELWSPEQLLLMFKAQAALGSLSTQAVAVNTELPLAAKELAALAQKVSVAVGSASAA